MASAEHVSRQVQPYLPGLEPHPSEVKQPHQMSPREFAEHPLAVYHASRSTSLNSAAHRSENRMHAGTERSAVDRLNDGWQGDQMFMHVFHTRPRPDIQDITHRDHELKTYPEASRLTLSSEDLSRAARLPSADNADRFGYYHNLIEHPGSVSVVVASGKDDLISHSDAVSRAISEGKEHEVHPETLALFKTGGLQPRSIHPDEAVTTADAARLENKGTYASELYHPKENVRKPGTQQAWAFGRLFNDGLGRNWVGGYGETRLSPLGHGEVDPRLGKDWVDQQGRDSSELIDDSPQRAAKLAERDKFNDVVENARDSILRHPLISSPRGPDLDRIRHYYRAGGFTQ